jgi:hypothetical protein
MVALYFRDFDLGEGLILPFVYNEGSLFGLLLFDLRFMLMLF